ncbi:MAG: type II secretion system protein [Erysipelotrichaceae bacterium]
MKLNNKGITLVEVLVISAITTILIGAIGTVFLTTNNIFNSNSKRIHLENIAQNIDRYLDREFLYKQAKADTRYCLRLVDPQTLLLETQEYIGEAKNEWKANPDATWDRNIVEDMLLGTSIEAFVPRNLGNGVIQYDITLRDANKQITLTENFSFLNYGDKPSGLTYVPATEAGGDAVFCLK